jgi:hypothetical protein
MKKGEKQEETGRNGETEETSLETRQAMAWKSIQCNLFFLLKKIVN